MSQLDPSTSLSLSSPSLICIKLEDPNFGVWKPRMTYALQSRKLWWHASGKSTRPVRKAGEKDDEYQSKVDKWDEDDEAASALICMYIGDSQLHHVSGCTSAAETWTKLLAAHEKRGMNHALQFVHGISSARLLEDGKVQEYINKMRSDNDRLRATGLGIEYNDALLAAHLMFSFPASYEPIKMTLATLEQKDFTFETVSRAMLNEDARRAVAASASAVPAPVLRNDGEAAALAAATATLQAAVGKKTRQDAKDKLVCNWCGLKRHVEATCWKKKGGHPQQVRNQHPPQSNLAQSQDGNIFLALACDHLRDSAVDDGSDVAVTAPLVAAAGSTALAADEPCVSVHARLPPKTAPGPNSKLSWYIDSGASQHYCNQRDWFTTFEPNIGRGPTLKLGDGRSLTIAGHGSISVRVPISASATESGHFDNVQYAPELAVNLLSVSAMVDKGLDIRFDGRQCTIRNSNGKVIGRAARVANKLYELIVSQGPQRATKASATSGMALPATATQTGSASSPNLDLLHRRLGHVNHNSIRAMLTKNLVLDVDAAASAIRDAIESCDACRVSKSHRQPFPKEATRATTAPLQLVHTDICGPFRTASPRGSLYFMVIIDDFTRYLWLQCLISRGEASHQFQLYTAWAENVHQAAGHRVRAVRMDNAKELAGSKEFARFIQERGISLQLTATYSPQQNGVSERSNRTIVEAARAMLHSSQLPHELWTEAVTAAAYIRNRCTTRAVDGKTPYEAWWGVKPSIGHLRVWGCLAYPHRPASHRAGKWDVKAIRCSMVGYSPNSNTYRLWDHVNRKIIESRDVVFVEDKLARDVGAGPDATVQTSELLQLPEQLIQLPNDGLSDISEPILRAAVGGSVLPAAPSESDDELVLPYIPLSSVREEKEQLPALIPPPVPSGVGMPQQAILPPSALQPHQQSQPSVPSSAKLPLALRKLLDHNSPGEKDLAPSAVAMNSPESSADSLGLLCALVSRLSRVEDSTADPTTLKQARDCANAKHWEPEIQAEMNSMRRAEVWDAVELPDGKHAIDSRLVFKTKRDAAGNIIRYKVRLCAKGFSQRPGVDYSETFAPVARLTSIRAILAMVAHHDWELDQMDVQSAYLNAPLTEEVYMRLPEGLAAAGERHLVCKLKKSIYGLKQAGREWNKHVDAALKSLGFIQILADACIYVYQRGNVIVINSLYVDDLLLCSNNRGRLNIVKQELEDRYQMTDLGEARYVLGIEIRRDRKARTLSILQVGYVKEILERFQMSGCRPISTPMDSNNKLVAATDEDALDATATKDYQARVGALMYAMLGTRPDISYAVTALSQFCSKPSTIHAQAVKRVFRYLSGTIQHGITYRGTEPTSTAPTLLGYCDSDWAEDRVDRRSITGYVFLLANAAVSWKSRKQDTIALSSVEAEYMAATEAVKEALWWRMFLRGVGYATPDPTTILSDSQGSIAISLNSVNHQRTKHIDVRHHFIREHIREKNVRLQYVSTTQMAADILTKALGSVKHNPIKELTGMRQV